MKWNLTSWRHAFPCCIQTIYKERSNVESVRNVAQIFFFFFKKIIWNKTSKRKRKKNIVLVHSLFPLGKYKGGPCWFVSYKTDTDGPKLQGCLPPKGCCRDGPTVPSSSRLWLFSCILWPLYTMVLLLVQAVEKAASEILLGKFSSSSRSR